MAVASASASGHTGWWAAGRARQASRPARTSGVASILAGLLTSTSLVASIGWTRPRSGSAEEDLGLGHPLRWHRLERSDRFGQGNPDDVGAMQREHLSEVLVVNRVSGCLLYTS